MRRREFIGLGVGGVAAVSLGAGFWDELFGSAESKPLRRGRGYGPLRDRRTRTGCACRRASSRASSPRGDQVVAGTDYRWHIASDGMATFPDARRRVRARLQLRDPRRRRLGAAHRPRRQGARRLPDPVRHDPELLRRRHAVGHLAVLRGDRGRPGLGVRPGRAQARASAHPAMGVFKHEAAAVDPHAAPRLHDRGPDRRRPLPLHAASAGPTCPSGLLEIASVGKGGAVDWVEVPDPSAARERTRAPGARQHALQARRGHLVRRPHALRVDHRRRPRARLRHPARAHPGGLRRARLRRARRCCASTR